MYTQSQRFVQRTGIREDILCLLQVAARFKKGHGICKLAVQEEQLNASVDTFCKEFLKCIEEQNLEPDQIYNADTTGVYWKGLPKKHSLS